MFDEPTKKIVYTKQTEEAKSKGISNCPLCALENNSNKKKIWKLSEMDADHVTAWSKGVRSFKEGMNEVEDNLKETDQKKEETTSNEKKEK